MIEGDYMPKFVNDPSNLHLKEYFRKEGIDFDLVCHYAGKKNMFSRKLNHGGKFTDPLKRMYVRGKVNYVDNIDVDLFNVDKVHMFVQDLGYDPKQLMFYDFKVPNKSLDYGLKPLSCDIRYWLTSADHHYLSPFNLSFKITELDDYVRLKASVVVSRKRLTLEWINKDSVCKSKERLALDWINEDDFRESSVDKNGNVDVNEE
uniref:Transposase, MuDR n=1 Tax=Tanacetum cinerariifolium TaxID=118510 RepID=A0A699HNJ2_TANCI|nr:transposase, MuDR [Tanacetum cinerariifolium]